MNETSIRSEMKKMLYDLFDAGFDKNEILDIMSQGTRGLRGAQGNEEKSLIESLANGNGISVKEFVKYCKENRKSMGLALKEAVEKEQDMIKPQPAPAEEEHSEDGQPAPAEEEHVEEEQPAPTEEEHVEEEQPAPAEEEHREEEQPEPAEEEHSEEEQPPLIEEEHGEQKLSPKGKKLLAKVNELCVRIEKEKNPLKVYILKFQVRRLQARIQRELDLINIQESYAAKRADLKSNSAEKDGENVEEVAKLANQIYLKKQKLKSNSEFDYKSPDFLFDKETIQRQGGIENISKTLQESDKADVRDTGKRLEEMIRIRQELAKDEKDYK